MLLNVFNELYKTSRCELSLYCQSIHIKSMTSYIVYTFKMGIF